MPDHGAPRHDQEQAVARPWDELAEVLASGDARRLEAFLEGLPDGEVAHTLAHLDKETRARVLIALPPGEAADVIEQVPDVQAVHLVHNLPPRQAAAILRELPSDAIADILGGLEAEQTEAILAEMDPGEALVARTLAQYADFEAGGLMVTEFLGYPEHRTVREVIDNLRANAERFRDIEVQYLYVTADGGKLTGVLPMRDLLLAEAGRPIGELMIRHPLTVDAGATLAELRDFFLRHHLLGVPVVDPTGRLLGIVQRTAVEEAHGHRSDSDYRRSQGIVSEEMRSMPLVLRARRRLSWLSVNIVLNIVSASVIGFYLDTLDAVIALAVFLPIISDMSGCSGNQAVAVSMRELTLGLVRPHELLRVWGKEAMVGAMNGAALGALLAAVAWAWKDNPYLGLVVGGALALNTLVAVSIGGTVPLLLRRIGMDPALASGPILTTVTDMCGFFLALSFAALLLPWLA